MVVVVPLRDRRSHLEEFACHIDRFLGAYQFRLVVVEQLDEKPFNRGTLLNIGFELAKPTCEWVVFHDVDMLPVDASCDYSAPKTGMRHLAGAVEQFGFRPPYRNYVGGVLLATVGAFESLNGFSNGYWGWGCEDDDLFLRACVCGLAIERVPGRYRSLPHPSSVPPAANGRQLAHVVGRVLGYPEPVSDERIRWIRRAEEGAVRYSPTARDLFAEDGLSSLHYRVVRRRPLADYLGVPSRGRWHEVVAVELLGRPV